jgi:hypothetical protein
MSVNERAQKVKILKRVRRSRFQSFVFITTKSIEDMPKIHQKIKNKEQGMSD